MDEQHALEGEGTASNEHAVIADIMLDRLTGPYFDNVRQMLTATLGRAVADWFLVVPAGQAGRESQLAALLLANHLPILVPVNEVEASSVFFILTYDIHGRRTESPDAPQAGTAKHHSLAEALVAADLGFRILKRQAELQDCGRFYGTRVGPTAEERWLHEQFCVPRTAAPQL